MEKRLRRQEAGAAKKGWPSSSPIGRRPPKSCSLSSCTRTRTTSRPRRKAIGQSPERD